MVSSLQSIDCPYAVLGLIHKTKQNKKLFYLFYSGDSVSS